MEEARETAKENLADVITEADTITVFIAYKLKKWLKRAQNSIEKDLIQL